MRNGSFVAWIQFCRKDSHSDASWILPQGLSFKLGSLLPLYSLDVRLIMHRNSHKGSSNLEDSTMVLQWSDIRVRL